METTAPDVTDMPSQPEEVLDSKVVRGGLQYLVKWKDKPRSENTWEKRSNLVKPYKPLLDTFHAQNPTAPRMPTIVIAPRSRRLQLTDPDERQWEYWKGRWDRWRGRCRQD
ncbi:hypothetical protein TRAPUB_8245 [Trametes pubescens]|uniref:Chromo domain-containing protein n=1 Tax=Trametes pubescens TaxID=154538 RepID=A0A1M2W5V6_TRAPU|nr:hypothetical protein TRAPUB_8245 [Trametes pubescens]